MNNWTLIYVDDLNIGKIHPLESAKIHLTQEKEKKTIHAKHCEERFMNIKMKSEEIGMRINAQKTQLLLLRYERK